MGRLGFFFLVREMRAAQKEYFRAREVKRIGASC